jgi:hypothetical protein
MNGYIPLREEAVERAKLIKAANKRHAPPDEACKLIANFAQSEINIIRYIEANSVNCGISPLIADQLKTGHKNTEAMQIKICRAPQNREPAGLVGDFEMFVDGYRQRHGPY